METETEPPRFIRFTCWSCAIETMMRLKHKCEDCSLSGAGLTFRYVCSACDYNTCVRIYMAIERECVENRQLSKKEWTQYLGVDPDVV